MGLWRKLIFLIFAVLAVYTGLTIKALLEAPEVPKLDEPWWGPGKAGQEDISIKPFKINIPEQTIKDLQARLTNARQPVPPLEGIAQQYGINANLLKEIVDFWKTKYNWTEREKFLNQFPQYTTSIQGLKIHYLHVKPQPKPGVRVLPLLLFHGWPGSVREFYEIIPLLTQPRQGYDFVFEVIAPSLPGYGFSEGAVRPGLGAIEISTIFKNLMERLGFDKYYLQGGDWGAIIVQHISEFYPEKVLGVHSNICLVNTPLSNLLLLAGSYWPSLVVEKEHEHKVYPRLEKFQFLLLELGYLHLQATKPDTVGVALNDSPVGLAAYILEKFTTWTNPQWKERLDGGLKEKYTYTNLLDNVMIYWVTGSITTSMRLYSETFNKKQFSYGSDRFHITVPSACARFTYDVAFIPNIILKTKYKNLLHVADYDGGHFPAFEMPNVLANDIFVATGKFLNNGKNVKSEL